MGKQEQKKQMTKLAKAQQPFAFSSPNLNFEFYDGAAWYTLATQSYVNSSVFNINTNTSGQLAISRLNGYPASTATFLRGDGSWTQVSLASNVTGSLPIANLSGYPANAAVYLNGNGAWTTPSGTGIPYVNSLPINGTLNLSTYSLTTTGNVSAQTGSLIANGLQGFSSDIAVASHFNMDTHRIYGVAEPTTSSSAATKNYVDVSSNNLQTQISSLQTKTAYMSYNSNDSNFPVYFSRQIYINNTTIPFVNERGTYGYLNSGGSTGIATDAPVFDLKCNNRIRASEFDAWSSIKKKNIVSSDKILVEKEALDLFNSVNFFKYNYIDPSAEGSYYNYGVIAEDLNEGIPAFVNMHDIALVPNIFASCSILQLTDNTFRLTFESDLTKKLESTSLKVLFGAQGVSCEILETGTNYLAVEFLGEVPAEVPAIGFAYGTEEACPTVSKQKLFELSCIVLRNVLDRVGELEAKIALV